MRIQIRLYITVAALGLASCVRPESVDQQSGGPALGVRMDTEEADAAVAILNKRHAGLPVGVEEWARLFGSDGYRRLKQREHAMGRAFEDSTFQAFLLSDTVAATAPARAAAVDDWRQADLSAAARLALAYLPAGTHLRATLYPVIKPQPNSFVFDVGSDPALFIYVDPAVSRAKLENTLAHELHHIGHAAACPGPDTSLVEPVRTAVTWAGAFAEGLAMLAAAGGPDIHPHAVSGTEERDRWDRDVANVGTDMRRVETFFLDVLDGRLADPDAIRSAAMSFFGVQGPWYTVGWAMATTVEVVYGRDRLIEVMCASQRLMATYNAAAAERNAGGESLPLWSPTLLARFGSG